MVTSFCTRWETVDYHDSSAFKVMMVMIVPIMMMAIGEFETVKVLTVGSGRGANGPGITDV